ncbi:retrovirus-related pol polyprotein from transposon TNT 1-94 [Tanacetum coccineum]
MKVKESLKVIFDESPPPTKLSSLVDDDVGEEEAIKNNTKVVNNNNEEDESIEVDKTVNIKESKNHPLDQALKDESWVVAMQEELNQFVANDVWELVPLPMSQSVIGTKWVFRNKLDENGIVSRNKARLVAQGYNQQEGIDYDETYAPVARLESIRILLAIACANDFKLYQMDVKSAFLNGFINEEVYVAQPPGFIDFQKPNYVYKLKKALHGLKQALKAWLEDSKPTKTPISTEIKLTKDDEADFVDSSKYRGTKMPSEYQQDYKKTRAYAPKIYNDPNIFNALRDIYKTLESRYVHEGRTIDTSFYNDLSDDLVAKFTAIGFCIYSNAWGLDELEKTLEQIEPYNSHLSALDDI